MRKRHAECSGCNGHRFDPIGRFGQLLTCLHVVCSSWSNVLSGFIRVRRFRLVHGLDGLNIFRRLVACQEQVQRGGEGGARQGSGDDLAGMLSQTVRLAFGLRGFSF